MNKLRWWSVSYVRIGFIITVVIFVLCSCINIESKISFLEDGSGLIRLKYVLPTFGDMKNKENKFVVSLGLAESNYYKLVEQSENLRLIEYVTIEGETKTEIIVTIGFNKIEELSEIQTFSPLEMELISSGNKKTFSQVLYNNNNIKTDEGKNNLSEDIMNNATITFVIETPADISRASTGVVAGNRRSVKVVLPLSTFLYASDKSYLSIDW